MPVLYRKYRPQTFVEVVGQKSIIQTLQNQVAAGAPAHAYLFVGSRGVGKTSVARILAKAVNCEERTKGQGLSAKLSDACGECNICTSIQKGNFMDLIEIDAASNTGVDNVRDLIEHVRFAPALAKHKVIIIDEVHMLSKGAFNALLKTLEEPPAHAIFILATTEPSKVPPTIISRTQRFDFTRLKLEEVEKHLADISNRENLEVSIEALKAIAQLSEGGLRDALSLLDKVSTLGNKPSLDAVFQLLGVTDTQYSEELLGYITNAKVAEIPVFLEILLEKGIDFVSFNRDFLEYLRKILVLKITGAKAGAQLTESHLTKAGNFAESLSESSLIYLIRLFLRSLKEQSFSPAPDLPILVAAAEAALGSKNQQPTKNENLVFTTPKRVYIAPVVNSTQVEKEREQKNSEQSDINLEKINANPKNLLSLEEISARWEQVLEKLKNKNGPLAHLLKFSPIDSVVGPKIIVKVKYKFHKQNLEHPKNLDLIGKILVEIYGEQLIVEAQVVVPEKEGKPDFEINVAKALKVFGGELAE